MSVSEQVVTNPAVAATSVRGGNKLDRRCVRTRRLLAEALREALVTSGDLSKVTVSDVTDRADMTRRTFYSHYKDIPDLVEHCEQALLDELKEYLVRLSQVDLEDFEHALDAYLPVPGSLELLEWTRLQGPFLAAILGDAGDPRFQSKLCDLAHDVFFERAQDGFTPPAISPLFDYYLTFVISAEVGVLVRWLQGGMQESAYMMAVLMTGLLFVRPGDLYAHPIDLDIPRFACGALHFARNAASIGSKEAPSR